MSKSVLSTSSTSNIPHPPSNLTSAVVELLDFIKGKTNEQIEQCLDNFRKEADKQEEIKRGRTFSLLEYNQHLSSVLTEENLKKFLECCRCRNLIKLLYPNNDDTKPRVFGTNVEEDNVDESLDDLDDDGASTEEEWFILELIRILKRINIRDRNSVRLNFNTFLDVCWQAVSFDLWGKGNIDKVVMDHDSERPTIIKPGQVRKLFIDYIRGFFISKGNGNKPITNQGVNNYLKHAFQGKSKLFKS